MPSAVTIVMIFLAVVAVLTWFVPTSAVVTDGDNTSRIIYNAAIDGEGNIIENAGTDPVGIWEYFTAHPGLCGCGRDRNIYPGVRRDDRFAEPYRDHGCRDRRTSQTVQRKYADNHPHGRICTDGQCLRSMGGTAGLCCDRHSAVCFRRL